MAKGSPGGILMIAVGVVLLNLAATDRFRQVWIALSTGQQADTAPGAATIEEDIGTDVGENVNQATQPRAPAPSPSGSPTLPKKTPGGTALKAYAVKSGTQPPSGYLAVKTTRNGEWWFIKANDRQVAIWESEVGGVCSNWNSSAVRAVENRSQRGVCFNPKPPMAGDSPMDLASYNDVVGPTGLFARRYAPNVAAGFVQ